MFNRRFLTSLLVTALAGSTGPLMAASPPPDMTYQIQPILKLGDPIGDGSLVAVGRFKVGSLNDNGQLVLALSNSSGDTLLQYSGGVMIPLVVPGGPGPQGAWPQGLSLFPPPLYAPIRMNQQGSITFAATDAIKNQWLGVFRWDSQTHQVTPVALPGTTVGDSVTLTATQDSALTAAINNAGEVAFAARFKGASGAGLFLQGTDGKLSAVALPQQSLPNGKKLIGASLPTLNDAGQIGFLGGIPGLNGTSAIVASQGALAPAALVGQTVAGAGKILDTNGIWVNSQNGNVLVFAAFKDAGNGPFGLLLQTATGLVPVAVPGTPMPGGGTFKTLALMPYYFTISDANDRGQHAFLATITEDGQSKIAAYRLDADGSMALIAQTGSATDLGVIDQMDLQVEGSRGVSLNNKGQVALPLRIHGLPSMVALLTPKTAGN